MDMCVNACNALGEGLAQWVFVALAFAWGWWNKRQAAAAKLENTQLKASLKPGPIPIVHFQGAPEGVSLASLLPPRPSGYSPAYEPEGIAETMPETPKAKDEAAGV